MPSGRKTDPGSPKRVTLVDFVNVAPLQTKLTTPTRNIPPSPTLPPRTRPVRRLPQTVEVSVLSLPDQPGRVGEAVENPPRVRVLDTAGYPLGSTAVTFSITAGDGTIGPTPLPNQPRVLTVQVLTTPDGEAVVPVWRLLAAGTHIMAVFVTPADEVPRIATFTATATS